MYLTDTHCHLDLDRFDDDRDLAIERAKAAGVGHMLIPAINLTSAKRIAQIVRHYEGIFGAYGVHPLDANAWTSATLGELQSMLEITVGDKSDRSSPKKIVAIGEIGLDHFWQQVPANLQQKALVDQLELAGHFGLPVILHMRENNDQPEGSCSEQMMPILQKWLAGLRTKGSVLADRPGVLHSFSGSKKIAQVAIELGFYIGVTGPITYKNSELKSEVVKSLPLDKILIETDSPFLAPIPFRGKRNEPAHVQYVANKVAQILDISPQKAAYLTAQNAARLFAWEASF